MKARVLAKAIVLALALPLSVTAIAADQAAPVTATAQAPVKAAYLGVILGPVPGALRAQLAGVLPAGQGVIVRDVAEDSPAAKAGLKPYDILLDFGDQRLFSAEQLSQLVKTDSPNRVVVIKLVRNGVTENVNVTLGEAQSMAAEGVPADLPWMPMQRRYARPMGPFGETSSQASADNWETFDSLSLEKRGDGSYQAEIQYLDVNRKLVKQQFNGSREEIREQVMKQRDLPVIERDQLLDALSARDDPGWPVMRFGHHMLPPRMFHGYPDF